MQHEKINIANVMFKLTLEMAAHGMVMLQFHKVAF